MRNVGKNNFMRKLALSDEILLKISQPARYIGGEVNMVKKDPSKVAVRFAMCFSGRVRDRYVPSGIQILYDMFNRRDDVYCERVYSPWMDLDPIMREQKIPLFAVESQDPIKKFDFLGITIQYEMCYTNILQVLELSQIRSMQKIVPRRIRSLSAAVRVPTIRSRLHHFSISSTWVRERWCIMTSSTATRRSRRAAAASGILRDGGTDSRNLCTGIL